MPENHEKPSFHEIFMIVFAAITMAFFFLKIVFL